MTTPESLSLEFKQARSGLPTDVFESVCAFLNRQGGHLLLGVRNDGLNRLAALGVSASVEHRLSTELAYFLAGESLTSLQVAKRLQAAARMIYRDFQVLREAGLIEPTNTYGYYRLAE